MKNISNVSTPKKVLFIGLGILVLGIVVLAIGLLQYPAIWEAFQCGYDLSLNNSSLTRDQISDYCNNQTLKTQSAEDLIAIGFGIIVIVIAFIITRIGGIWLIVRSRRRERTEASGAIIHMMDNSNEDYRFTSNKVLAFCINAAAYL